MSRLSREELDRLNELLADEQLDQLSPEDRGELDELRLKAGDAGDAAPVVPLLTYLLGKRQGDVMPAALRAKIEARGREFTGTRVARRPGHARTWWVGVAALMAIMLGAAALLTIQSRTKEARQARAMVTSLEARIKANEEVIATARAQANAFEASVASAQRALSAKEAELAAASAARVELAAQLAVLTADLEEAKLAIAKFEEPVDPALLAQNRKLLLEVPGTVRLAWQPFDLPDAPAEQRGVSGDVVWNDEKEEGYLRFVGLAVNDPAKEQYQVWVIDERGMEQKVSGGVFNASAEGEVIVPIHPGIDVRQVKVFAVTVEEPGGTWVPDLRRRVVVAPRG